MKARPRKREYISAKLPAPYWIESEDDYEYFKKRAKILYEALYFETPSAFLGFLEQLIVNKGHFDGEDKS